MRNYPWTLDDLILALDFHLRCGPPRKETKLQFFVLVDLLFPHSEQSVKAQIRNFVSLDPKGSNALSHASKKARRVWEEFVDDRKRLRAEARSIRTNRPARSTRS